MTHWRAIIDYHDDKNALLISILDYHQSIPALVIRKCPSVIDFTSLFENDWFKPLIFGKFSSLVAIKVKVDKAIKVSLGWQPKADDFDKNSPLLIAFESTVNNQVVVFWRNTKSKDFLKLDLTDETLTNDVKSFDVDFIGEASRADHEPVMTHWRAIIDYHEKKNPLVASILDYHQSIPALTIRKCPLVIDFASLLKKDWFKPLLFGKFSSLVAIRVKVNEEIKAPLDWRPRVEDFDENSPLLIAFESTLNNQVVVFWRNKKSKDFSKLDLTDENLTNDVKKFAVDFIDEAFRAEHEPVYSNSSVVTFASLRRSNGSNFLTSAMFKKRVALVKELLKYPFDVNMEIPKSISKKYAQKRLIDIAWNDNQKEIMLALLQAGSVYPEDFDREKIDGDVEAFYKIAEKFHNAIRAEKIPKIKKLMEKNRHERYFFMPAKGKSLSALNFSLKKKNIEIYKVLISHNLTFGTNEVLELPEDNDKFITDVSDTNSDWSKVLSKQHLMILQSKSVIPHTDVVRRSDCSKLISEGFETINCVLIVEFIMRVVATDKRLRLHFDLTQMSINYMDVSHELEGTRGLFRGDFFIYIAAKDLTQTDDKKREVYATMSHELDHCNEDLVFRNESKPYGIDDEVNKDRFGKILEECRKIRKKEDIVARVFENYAPKLREAELIVRVPHMMVYYKDDEKKLKELKETFKSLFDYYDEVVVPAMKQTLPVLELLAKESHDIKYEKLTSPLKAAIRNSKVMFQGGEVCLKSIIDESSMKFLDSSQIRDVLNGRQIEAKAKQKAPRELGFYAERRFIESSFDGKVYGERGIITEETLEEAKSSTDLAKEAKHSRILLLADRAGEGKSTTMWNLSQALKKYEENADRWVSYVDLKGHINYFKILNEFDNIVEMEPEQILDVFKSMLSLEEDSIEASIFAHLFRSNRVILFLDGFDEIAPKYKILLLSLTTSIFKKTKNVLWIATRPHHSSELQEIFNCRAFKLLPLDKLEVKSFAERALRLRGVTDESKLQRMTMEVHEMREKLKFIENPLMLQMLCEMAASEKIQITQINEFNNYTLFERMVEYKRDILAEEKSSVAVRDMIKDANMSLTKVHQVYAFMLLFPDGCLPDRIHSKTFFRPEVSLSLNSLQLFKAWKKEKKDWFPEKISRLGLLIVDNWNLEDAETPDFMHRTVAEFFVVKFVIDGVREVIEELEESEKSANVNKEAEGKKCTNANEEVENDKSSNISKKAESENSIYFKEAETKMEQLANIAFEVCKHDKSGVMKNFFTSFLSQQPEGGETKLSEIICKFLEQRKVSDLITDSVEFCKKRVRLVPVIKLARLLVHDERALRAMLCIKDGYSRLFEKIYLKSLGMLNLIELFDAFKYVGMENWHQLTKFGKNIKNLPSERDLSMLDFVKEFEVDPVMPKERNELKHMYQYFCFLATADDIPRDHVRNLTKCYSGEHATLTLRSRALIDKTVELFQKYSLQEFSLDFSIRNLFVLSEATLWYLDRDLSPQFVKNVSHYIKKFEPLFHVQSKEAFEGELLNNLRQCNDMLYTGIFHDIDSVKDFFKGHISNESIRSALTLHTPRIVRGKIRKLHFERLDDFFADISESYWTTFQNFFNFCENFDKLLNVVEELTVAYGVDWENQSGYEFKDGQIKTLTEKYINEIVTAADSNSKENIRSFCRLLNFFLLCKIPPSDFENFLKNSASKMIKYAIENDLLSTLRRCFGYEVVAKILFFGFDGVAGIEPNKLGNFSIFFEKFCQKYRSFTETKHSRFSRRYIECDEDSDDETDAEEGEEEDDDDEEEEENNSNVIDEESDDDSQYVVQFENKRKYENALKVSETFLQILSMVYYFEIPDEFFEGYSQASAKALSNFVFRSRSMVEKLLDIFYKIPKTALVDFCKILVTTEYFTKRPFSPGFGNGYFDDNPNIRKSCRVLYALFWTNLEEYFESDENLMRQVLMPDVEQHHPLLIAIRNEMTEVLELYMKYCGREEVLSMLIKKPQGIGIYYEGQSFSNFFCEYFSDGDEVKHFVERPENCGEETVFGQDYENNEEIKTFHNFLDVFVSRFNFFR